TSRLRPLSGENHKDRKAMIHRVFCCLDLSCVTSWGTGCFWIVINDAIVGKIVGVMTTCMKYRNGCSIRTDLRTSGVSLVDPNPLSAAVYPKFAQSSWFEIV